MSSSRVPVSPRLLGFRLRTDAAVEDARPTEGPEQPPHVAAPALAGSIKDLQRRAFERGRELEREESGAALHEAASALAGVARDLGGARAADRPALQDFAVKLACAVAEVLTARTFDEDAHDVRALVQQVLDEALPDAEGDGVALHCHPDDAGRLEAHLRAGEAGSQVKLVPDPGLQRGEFRARGGEVEYYSGIHERLAEIRSRLLRDVERSDAS